MAIRNHRDLVDAVLIADLEDIAEPSSKELASRLRKELAAKGYDKEEIDYAGKLAGVI